MLQRGTRAIRSPLEAYTGDAGRRLLNHTPSSKQIPVSAARHKANNDRSTVALLPEVHSQTDYSSTI